MKYTFKRMDPTYIIFIAGLLGVIGAFWSQRNQDEENKQRHEQIIRKNDELVEENRQTKKQLTEKSDQVQELQRRLIERSDFQIQKTEEIAKLNAELADSQKEIARLSTEIANSVTGGSSFCYVTFSPANDNKIRINVFQRGKYALSNLKIYITNISAIHRIAGDNGPMIRGMGRSRHDSAKLIEVGNLSPSPTPKFVGELNLSANNWTISDSYHIEFFANNGSWEQQCWFVNNEGHVSQYFVIRRGTEVLMERN